jgi:hypothetical protein
MAKKGAFLLTVNDPCAIHARLGRKKTLIRRQKHKLGERRENMRKSIKLSVLFPVLLAFFSVSVLSAKTITTPKEFLGFNIGDDYHLANYTQLEAYWKKLEQESERIKLVEFGTSAEGRTMLLAIITSPDNHKNLDRYRDISRRLALAEGLSENEAQRLASEGRAVVWIDGGLHGTEVLGAQQIIELVYRMAAMNDKETLRILDNVILLASCTNPDGMELVSDWYMRETDPLKRSTRNLPRLYHKYIGHDNNRDFYMSTQPETEAVNRVLYREWFPQIVYNHHQSGPAGTVLFAPPFRDPFNYCFDPLVPLGIELVGAAMHNRFAAEGKPGATMRSGARYSTWWNGGLRTTVYFHNIIGILTEAIGNPTPMAIPFIPEMQLPKNDLPYPIAPQEWHFRQSVEYSITADKAILDLASKLHEDFLLNIYKMGKNSIDKGSRDSWTISAKTVADVEQAIEEKDSQQTGSGRSRGYAQEYFDLMHQPADRDPRGYIIPSDQPDFLTATKFINTLVKNGIFIHQATQDFEIGGKTYPKDSYVVKSSQAFRPHLLTMFEPQFHPDDIPYPGAPPTPTYDNAGWTVAFQMGVEFDRILEGFDGPFEKIEGMAPIPAGRVTTQGNPAGFLLSHRINDSFTAINRLLKNGEKVYWMKKDFQVSGQSFPAGTFFIPAQSSTKKLLEQISAQIGLTFTGIPNQPGGEAYELKPIKMGLWDQYGGSSSSGWIRWLLEQFEFPFEVVYPPSLDEGSLKDKFDVLIFPGGAIPSGSSRGENNFPDDFGGETQDIPEEYMIQMGRVTASETIPELITFLKEGGAILTLGSSSNLASHAGLPIGNALVEKLQDGSESPLPSEKYFVPGSILQVKVDNSNPLAHGLPERVDVTFSRSPVFKLKPEALLQNIRPVAWFDSDKPLRSGWAWGQHYLEEGLVVIEAGVGKGKLFIFGPEIAFRGQPHGTFKFLFNGIYYGSSDEVVLKNSR